MKITLNYPKIPPFGRVSGIIVICGLMLASALASAALMNPSPALADGAEQIAGIGYFAEPGECNDPQGAGADFALRMTGDLEGCHYVYVETATCSPSGTYSAGVNTRW
jgi:hypothetical protein